MKCADCQYNSTKYLKGKPEWYCMYFKILCEKVTCENCYDDESTLPNDKEKYD